MEAIKLKKIVVYLSFLLIIGCMDKTDERGFYIEGKKVGYNKNTKTLYDEEGYDKLGYDVFGWNKKGFNKYTGIKYDKEGYDILGYNKDNWNRQNIHKNTGTIYDEKGYTREGYDKEGYNRLGYNKEGYNKLGWNKDKINVVTKDIYDEEGYDINGYDKFGYNKNKEFFQGNFYKYLMNERFEYIYPKKILKYEYYDKIIEIQRDTLLELNKRYKQYFGMEKGKFEKTENFKFRKHKMKEEIDEIKKEYFILSWRTFMYNYDADMEEYIESFKINSIEYYRMYFEVKFNREIVIKNLKVPVNIKDAEEENDLYFRFLVTNFDENNFVDLKGYQIYYKEKLIKEQYF